MPITINGTTDDRVGFLRPSLGGLALDFDGTHTQPGTFNGSVVVSLGGLTIDFDGQSSTSESFNGSMTVNLGGLSANFIGNQIQNVNGQMSATLGGLTVSFKDTTALEQDWLFRTSGPGVVLHHNFASDTEVDAFRYGTGSINDPNETAASSQNEGCIRLVGGGFSGGGSLRINYVNSRATRHGSGWNRPLAPLSGASNGKGVDDPADGGALSLKPYDYSNPQALNTFLTSYYAHPDYHNDAADPYGPADFDGTEINIQVRMKISSSRYSAGGGVGAEPYGGKLWFLSTTRDILRQEIVQNNGQLRAALWYTDFARLGNMPTDGNNNQPGGDYDPDCGNLGGVTGCWLYPPDTWMTWWYRIVPGLDNVSGDSLFEAYVALEGETDWDLIFSYYDMLIYSPYVAGTDPHPKGYNAFQLTTYFNNFDSPGSDWDVEFDEFIVTRGPHPPPIPIGAGKTTLRQEAEKLAVGGFFDMSPNTLQNDLDVQWITSNVNYDESRRELVYMGKPASGQSTEFSLHIYNEANDAWSTVRPAYTGTGHIWQHAFDPATGDYYSSTDGSTTVRHFKRRNGITASSFLSLPVKPSTGGDDALPFGWHPNLFGPGNGGLVTWGRTNIAFYNPKTAAWTTVGSIPAGSLRNRNNGCARYVKGFDRLVFAMYDHNTGGIGPVCWVDAGAGTNPSTAISSGLIDHAASNTPHVISGLGTPDTAHIVIHPDNNSRILFLESGTGAGVSRVWHSDDCGDTWVLESGVEHPFNNMPVHSGFWTAGAFPGTGQNDGVVVGIGSGAGGGKFRIWKPVN